MRSAGWSRWSYWLDEAIQVRMTGGSLAELFRALRADPSHPPLDYLVSWAIQRGGGGEAALRGTSLLWSLAAAGLLARRAGGASRPVAALGTAAAFLALPASVHYGQEVRPYALALALVVAADVALDVVRRTRSRVAAAAHVLASLGAVATLYFAVFPLAALWVDELLHARRERRRPVGAAFAAGALAAAFLGAWLAWGASRPAVAVSAEGAWKRFPAVLLGLVTYREETLAWPVLGCAIWGLVLLGLAVARGERARLTLLVAATLGGPAIVLVATKWFWALRYFLFALPPIALAAGEAFAWLAPVWLRLGVAAAFLVALARPMANVVRGGRPDWRSVVGTVEAARGAGLPGDLLAADAWSLWCAGAQLPRARLPVLLGGLAEARVAVASRGDGWIVRTPHHPAAEGIDAWLGPAWWRAARAEDAAVYRFEGGRFIHPADHVFKVFGEGISFPRGGGVASRDAVVTLSRDVFILSESGPWSNGTVSATVQLTDDLDSAYTWVAVAARRAEPADGFRDSGYLGLLRANGEAVLYWPGGERKSATGVDPRRRPVRLALDCRGTRITFAVDERQVVSLDDGTFVSGWAGVHALGLARLTGLDVPRTEARR